MHYLSGQSCATEHVVVGCLDEPSVMSHNFPFSLLSNAIDLAPLSL